MPKYAEHVLILECNHLVIEPREYRDTVYCFHCGTHKFVAQRTDGYSYKCVDCRAGRRFGMARFTAGMKGTEHARKNPTHTVQVKLGNQVIELIRPKNIQPELFDSFPF